MEQHKESSSSSSTESKGVLGSVWSAAGAIAETVQHVVQGTIDTAIKTADRIQHEHPIVDDVITMGGYVANKVVDTANSVIEKTVHTAEEVLPTNTIKTEPTDTDKTSSLFSSPTDDLLAAFQTTIKPEPTITEQAKQKAAEVVESAKQTVSDAIIQASAKATEVVEVAKQTVSDTVASITPEKSDSLLSSINQIAQDNISAAKEGIQGFAQALEKEAPKGLTQILELIKPEKSATETFDFKLELTMDVVAHLQRIADRTGDQVLHETARKAHSACAKGLSDAPGVHLVRVTPEQATELVNLAIMTQDHELADFARYCQSVAATSQIGIEPAPGKIQEELAKGRQELTQSGRVHTGPGYGAAFASLSRSNSQQKLSLSRSNSLEKLKTEASSEVPASAETSETKTEAAAGDMQLNMDMVAHIQRIADRTGDKVLHDTARKAHSACAKGQSESHGVHLVRITPEQASELVNLAIRTQDPELANFARYCQSVAATNQIGIEPAPGKILEEIAKGRQELSEQGRTHTGPGYGAAFASISRSNSQQNLSLSRSNSSQNLSRSSSSQNLNLSRSSSRSSSPTNVPLSSSATLEQPQQEQQGNASQPGLQLTMDVVAHLQRIADRTGDALLHETARKAHSACAKNVSEAPGVHLTWVTPDQATELVNLAIRTQDTELADFARYCQSVAATTQIAVEPSPGKIKEEIEKGRLELLQQGTTHTGPGYGAAFASKNQRAEGSLKNSAEIKNDLKTEMKIEPANDDVARIAQVGLPAQ